ncbi:FHA domain protein (macronuclear) [Tetrahymena thermophila SB210]|uniref:FHA domain protein n=1 Tax=Tetrahymena thermophila (strain SB210) TaxID=312017 RepID=I7MGQ1_TETTS|nr:FHA domain protein [Tetrahymena thermophila SB210]EAS01810.2 FHA domain protein [Tetrahymena thermophila SB210]|eukprot:XP_001022055.2 FHA domain protein [Tetrahymena thermophila SB210]
MKYNEKSLIFQQFKQKFKQNPLTWDKFQTQQFLFFANIRFAAEQFQQKNLTLIKFLDLFDHYTIDIIYSQVLSFKNQVLQRMLFNKWLLLIIEYTIQLEENQPQSNQSIASQGPQNNSFDNLQHVKDEKNITISIGALSLNQLQLEQRPVNQQLTKILNIIIQDQLITTKQNTNIPEEREDEFEDDSIEGDEEDNESDDEQEEEINHQNRQSGEEDEQQCLALKKQIQENNQNNLQPSYAQSELKSMQNIKLNQDRSNQDQNEQFHKEQETKTHCSSQKSISQTQRKQSLHLEQKDNIINTSHGRSFKEDDIEYLKLQNSQSQEKIEILQSQNHQLQEQSIQNVNSQIECTNSQTLQKQSSIINRQIQSQKCNPSEFQDDCSQTSNPQIEMKKKSSDQCTDVNLANNSKDDEVNGSSKNIKRKSVDKSRKKRDSLDGPKNKNENSHSKRQTKVSHAHKMDEQMKQKIQEEAQKICKFFDDKQLIQWEKNELLSIVNKFKQFSDIEEILEKYQIDGFILFTIINEDLQLHDIVKILSITFTQASKLKNFIQILEPIRQQQVARINYIKRVKKLHHSSSIETENITQNVSPQNLNRSNNNSNQLSNSRQLSNPGISSSVGIKSQKNQCIQNTFDQLQDFQEYDDQKVSVNKVLKSSYCYNTNPNLQYGSSQMTFEIQTRDKLLSSTSDQDNQNFLASAEQQKNPMQISQDKNQSNYTILFSDSQTNLNLSKSKSPSQNRLIRTAFIGYNSNQNKASLGLSQHFNSEENQTSFDERRNISSQPTLGTSFHFEKNTQGNTDQISKESKSLIQKSLINSEYIQGITPNIGRQHELIQQNKQNSHILLNNELYPSKSTQLLQSMNQNNLINQRIDMPLNNFTNNSNILKEAEVYSQQDQPNKNMQENNLGNSAYIEQPLGMSQKVEKQSIQQQQEGNQEDSRRLRKVSSNNTLFQSNDQQHLSQILNNNLSNQNLSASQPQTNFINQSNYFTQSDNFDKSVKIKGIMKVQFQESQGSFQMQQQQQQRNNIQQNSQLVIQSSQSINSLNSPNINYQNAQNLNTNEAEINQLDQQQILQNKQPFTFQQNPHNQNFFPFANQYNNQIIQQTTNNNDLCQLKFLPEQIIENIQIQQQNINQCQQEQNIQENLQNQQQINIHQQQQQNLQDNFQQQNYQQNLNLFHGNQMGSNPPNHFAENINNNFFIHNQQLNTIQNEQPQLPQNGAQFAFNYGNSIPAFKYGQSINQRVQINNGQGDLSGRQENLNNFPIQFQQQDTQIQQQQENFQNQIYQCNNQNNIGGSAYQQTQQAPFNQGCSFICHVNTGQQLNQANASNNQNAFHNNMIGNSISFQQYPNQPQQFVPTQQQYLNNQCYNQFQNENIQANQYQNMYQQGNSYYFQDQKSQQSQHNQQQNNFGNSFIANSNQVGQSHQQHQNFGFYNVNNQQFINQPYNYQQNDQNQLFQNNNLNQQQNNIHDILDSNIPMKLPSIFKMNTANDDLLKSSDIPQESIIDHTALNIIKDLSQQEAMNQSQQNQMLLKYQSKNNQILKYTYNLPFNPFKFDIIPMMRVEVSTRYSSQKNLSYSFHSEGATIGRISTNTISFQDELQISASHAIIFYKKGEFFIQDIKSKAGTFIKIKSIPISADLILKLGEVEIKIVKIENNVVTIKVNGSNKLANLNRQQSYKVGRCSLRCPIALQDSGNTISNVHGEIHFNENKQICFTDLNSANGTWLRLSAKGQRSSEYKLHLNDQIMISNTRQIVVKELIG